MLEWRQAIEKGVEYNDAPGKLDLESENRISKTF